MIDLSHRSYQKELMDAPGIPFKAMSDLLRDLNIVNMLLGGHRITLKGVKQFIDSTDIITVCEIGCGGGDNIFTIYKYCTRNNIQVKFIGIDISDDCIAFAQKQYAQVPCRWICSDYSAVDMQNHKPTVIFSSLFCHHFTNEELLKMLQWMKENCLKGFFINDLHRHRLAYYAIKFLTGIFSRSYLMKNDACLSVARGFKKKEWDQLFSKAAIGHYHICWQWAFRYLVTWQHK